MRYWDECPDPYRARREGEEAGHRGWGLSNPYSERAREYRDQPYCDEAEQAWRMGRYAGEDRRREEDREAQHQAYLAQQEREYREQEQIKYEEEMPAPAEEEQPELSERPCN